MQNSMRGNDYKSSFKTCYYFIVVAVRQEWGGNSCKGKICGNDGTCVSVYEGFTETIW